ncbi:MAG: hypothetical protein HY791_33870 [Deltaproteobacteria bacterium]|nr:hypothetical protein [Deltaproteobacteria bacterium]
MSSEGALAGLHAVKVVFGPKNAADAEDVVDISEAGEGPADLGLLDPAELARRFPQPTLYARQALLLSEAFRAWTGATRGETIDYLARILICPKDPNFSRACLRELGVTTGIVDVYPLEVIEHILFAFPSHLPKFGFGRVFQRDDLLATLSSDTDAPLVLLPLESFKVRGFAVADGWAPGYRFEPGREAGTYALEIHSSGEYRVLVAGVSRAGYTLIDRFTVSVESGKKDLRRSRPAEPERDPRRVAAWPIPDVEVESLAGEIAGRSSLRRRAPVTVQDLARAAPKVDRSSRVDLAPIMVPELPAELPSIAGFEIEAASPWPTSTPRKKLGYAPTAGAVDPVVEPPSARPLATRKKWRMDPPAQPHPLERADGPRPMHFRSIESLPDSAVAPLSEPADARQPRSDRALPAPSSAEGRLLGGPGVGPPRGPREAGQGAPAKPIPVSDQPPKSASTRALPGTRRPAVTAPQAARAPRGPAAPIQVVPKSSWVDDEHTQAAPPQAAPPQAAPPQAAPPQAAPPQAAPPQAALPPPARQASPVLESKQSKREEPKRTEARPKQVMDDDTEVSG